jgi:hypothetical protein
MPPRYNATIWHPGISFLLFLLAKHPAIEAQKATITGTIQAKS